MEPSFSPAVLQWLAEHRTVDPMAVILQKSPFAEVSSKVLATQLAGMQVAAAKWPFLLQHPQYLYPSKTSLEQSSSAHTADYKAGLVNGPKVVDLTGGMGIDVLHFAQRGQVVTYVEPNAELCQLAEYNFKLLGYTIDVECTTAEQYLAKATTYDTIYIDPSRRVEGNKKTGMSNLQPNVVELQEEMLMMAKQVIIKLSPMQDLTEVVSTLSNVTSVYVVAVKEEVKELLVILDGKSTSKQIAITAVVLGRGEPVEISSSFGSGVTPVCGEVEQYLYQPHPAAVKANLHDHLAAKSGLTKLHPNTQLYSSADYDSEYLGRVYEVQEVVQLRAKTFRKIFGESHINIISKNHPLSPSQISKKIGVKQGGSHYLIAATCHDGSKQAYLARRLQ